MNFPPSNFTCQSLTTYIFFENISKFVNVKVHLHHSHVTGKIYGYVHDFWNWKVRENQLGFSCIAHNFFGFDFFFFFFVKRY